LLTSRAGADGRPISILAFPSKGNAYVDCFYPPIEALGVDVREGIFAGRWLLRNLHHVDYVHIHWPSFLYGSADRGTCLRAFALFLFLIALIRWRGARLIWTVHNLYPHDRCVIPRMDTWVRRILVKNCAFFLIHGPAAEQAVLAEFPATAGRTVPIEHGNWIGYYPNTIGRDDARMRMGLKKDDFVFLFAGLCKPYKNLELLIREFEELPGDRVLVIAGAFQDPKYQAVIQAAAERSRARIRLDAGFVPRDGMQIYMRACDVVVAPYAEVLTSGTAMLALSFGRPVVAPAAGHLRTIIQEGCGALYDPSQPDGLRAALCVAMNSTFDQSRILAEAAKHTWEETASIVLARMKQDSTFDPNI